MLQRADDADDDIDFSLLTSVLHSMEQVREGDEEWLPDRIWGEIKRELHLEAEVGSYLVISTTLCPFFYIIVLHSRMDQEMSLLSGDKSQDSCVSVTC